MKKEITTSSGILIINEFQEVLLAHPTHSKYWNIPKGGMDHGETPIQAAIRETEEETGLRFSPDSLEDMGLFSYLPAKNLHLFTAKVNKKDISIDDCSCTSMFFDAEGNEFPEMDRFTWANAEKVKNLCTLKLSLIILQIFDDLA